MLIGNCFVDLGVKRKRLRDRKFSQLFLRVVRWLKWRLIITKGFLLSRFQVTQSQRSFLADVVPQMVRLHNGRICRAPEILMSSRPMHPTLASTGISISRYGVKQRYNSLGSQRQARKHGIRALQRPV